MLSSILTWGRIHETFNIADIYDEKVSDKSFQPLTAKLFNLNLHPLKVVSR